VRNGKNSCGIAWKILPQIFAAEHAGFVTLVVSSKRGTLEGVR
jgi:hypothetical protein